MKKKTLEIPKSKSINKKKTRQNKYISNSNINPKQNKNNNNTNRNKKHTNKK